MPDGRRAPILVCTSYDDAVEGWRVRPKGSDGGTFRDFAVDESGHLQVDALTAPLPADAATQTTLAALLVELAIKADRTEDQYVTLNGEAVVLGASDGTDIGNVDVASTPEAAAGFESGTVAGTALTASFATLLTVSGTAHIVTVVADCDQAWVLTFDNGTTELRIPAGRFAATWDLKGNELSFTGTDKLRVKHDGTVPTSGEIGVLVMK